MTRVKRGVASHKRHKRLLKVTKGFKGHRKNLVKWAKNAKNKQGQNSYVGRKLKKRDMRSTWIMRINAACRPDGINYSKLTSGLLKAKVAVDRKILSELATNYPEIFKQFVEIAKKEVK
ncbi:MAG TPA: 50S ribosomal protein L20 [Candidatus Gracilibacteria bacterium]|nr:50S ribosomal protein L20 [Candidatus Gracilibacteria bacterium]HRY91716.1 50S ribosomal protein L20 [Candidatus Gracilibacteria bacterium]